MSQQIIEKKLALLFELSLRTPCRSVNQRYPWYICLKKRTFKHFQLFNLAFCQNQWCIFLMFQALLKPLNLVP